MNKSGQFYLLAAIIIVLAVSGIASVQTYAVTKPEARKLQDISSELEEEGARIVDYGIYNPGEDPIALLDSFTDDDYAPYFLKRTENTDIVFIYGNKANLWAVQYNDVSTGTISATIGSATTNWQIDVPYSNRTQIIDDGDDLVEIDLLGKTFEFDLKNNEMFYFIIAQEKEGETYIERN